MLSVVAITCASGCTAMQDKHQKDDWFASDKYTHFALSTAISAAAAKAAKEDGKDNCDAAVIGFSISISLGAAKEVYDKRKKQTLYSYKDMMWNTAGSALGSLAGSNCK